MIAGVYKIVCDQGSTFSRLLTIRNGQDELLDLTGYTARMQVRPEVDSNEVLVELTTENGRIALGGAAGTVLLHLPPEITATIPTDGFYDLEIVTNGGAVYRLLRGKFLLDPEVTR